MHRSGQVELSASSSGATVMLIGHRMNGKQLRSPVAFFARVECPSSRGPNPKVDDVLAAGLSLRQRRPAHLPALPMPYPCLTQVKCGSPLDVLTQIPSEPIT